MANPVDDKPNKRFQKVDFATILKRRRREARSYVIQQGITTKQDVKEHLVWLRKTYVVSADFEKDCLDSVTVPRPNPLDEAVRQAKEELEVSLKADEGEKSFFDTVEPATKPAPVKKRPAKKDHKGS